MLVWETDFGTGGNGGGGGGGNGLEEEEEEKMAENEDEDEDYGGDFVSRKLKKNKYGKAKEEKVGGAPADDNDGGGGGLCASISANLENSRLSPTGGNCLKSPNTMTCTPPNGRSGSFNKRNR